MEFPGFTSTREIEPSILSRGGCQRCREALPATFTVLLLGLAPAAPVVVVVVVDVDDDMFLLLLTIFITQLNLRRLSSDVEKYFCQKSRRLNSIIWLAVKSRISMINRRH